MGKSPTHISLLALLLSSEPHRDSLLKVLTAARVSKKTALERIEETKLKFFVEGKLITVNGEEDYAIYKETTVPYVEEYRNRRGLGFRPSCHDIVQALRGKHLHRLTAHYGKLSRDIPVPPLSHFFPGPPLVVGGTSDDTPTESEDSSSDTVEAPFVLLDVYAITEETSSKAPIRRAEENEELNNWTVVADV
ncbi:hypothetical protein CRG98_013301 [Punica granatum]|uniref:Uncharacterized protein n=1 Tax=Punica granatum TaxID=22663 RepID=A0A2I0KCT7_PUNGR|nr:hypothetical protein CRG98_013301 [Punica granatum]